MSVTLVGPDGNPVTAQEVTGPGPIKISTQLAAWDGVSYYRVHVPLEAMRRRKYVVHMPWARALEADATFIQRHFLDQGVSFVKFIRSRGVKLITDYDDDLLHVQPKNPSYQHYSPVEIRRNIAGTIKMSDAVFVTTKNLRTKVIELRGNKKGIYLLPNSLDFDVLWNPEQLAKVQRIPAQEGELTIGWSGSPSHRDDVQVLRGLFEALNEKYPNKLRFRMQGYVPQDSFFKNDLAGRIEGYSWVEVEKYPMTLYGLNIDIGLAPISANEFNYSKSNLKWVELSTAGAAVIASNLGPYAETMKDGKTGLLVRNRFDSWFKACCRLIENPSLRKELQEAAAEEVRMHYNMSLNCELWRQAVEELVGEDRNLRPFQIEIVPGIPDLDRPVTVIIPVHNAYDELVKCYAAVESELGPKVTLVLSESGSTDERVRQFCQEKASSTDGVICVSSETQVGFAAAVNRALPYTTSGSDLIILHSDAIPTQGFVRKLQAAAYPKFEPGQKPVEIGTVTPLTNHGGLANIPEPENVQGILDDLQGPLLEVPSSPAVCLYIKRVVVEEFGKKGLFDEEFGLGFGEDVDLCQRIRPKYMNVVDIHTFVHHKGLASYAPYAAGCQALQQKNTKTLVERYPHYGMETMMYRAADPIGPVRAAVTSGARPKKPRVLVVAHGYHMAAGTEQHIRSLETELGEAYDFYIAYPERKQIMLLHKGVEQAALFSNDIRWPVTPYAGLQYSEEALNRIIITVQPDVIHVQHTLGWPLCVIDQTCSYGVPVVVSLHDHYALTPDFAFRGARVEETLTQEYAIRAFQNDISEYLKFRRKIWTDSLKRAQMLVVPSQYLADTMKSVFTESDFRVIEHGIRSFNVVDNKIPGIIKFGFIGSLLPHKGWDVLLAAFRQVREEYSNVQMHFHGGFNQQPETEDRVFYHGPYAQDQLPHVIGNFDIGVVPSIVPETYCMTLSEIKMGGRPAICSRIGALATRITEGIDGKLFEPGDMPALVEAMSWFVQNPDVWEAWKIAPPRDLSAMAIDYNQLYATLILRKELETGKSQLVTL